MGKVAALAVVLFAAYFVFRPGGASADKVADCLTKSGVTVSETRLVQGAQGLPLQIKNRLLEVEKRNYSIQLGDGSGVLMLIRSNGSAEGLSRSLVAAEGRENVQRTGKFVMYWRLPPNSESTGIVSRCLS